MFPEFLQVQRFANRNYRAVFNLCDAITTDVALTAEESQILKHLWAPGMMADRHPNAHACRVKLYLNMHVGGIKLEFKLLPEVAGYISKRDHVSCYCRLTADEEVTALQLCTGKKGLQVRAV
jgi:hypothetical protein